MRHRAYGSGQLTARIVKAAGKQSWQMGKDAEKDGKTIHCNVGEKTLAGMAYRDRREHERPGQQQRKRP